MIFKQNHDMDFEIYTQNNQVWSKLPWLYPFWRTNKYDWSKTLLEKRICYIFVKNTDWKGWFGYGAVLI